MFLDDFIPTVIAPNSIVRKRELKAKLVDDKQDVTAIIMAGGVDDAALDAIIADEPKKQADESVRARAMLMREILNAQIALLKNGDIEPALRVAQKDHKGFKLLTSNKQDINALRAKVALFKLAEFNNPEGGFSDKDGLVGKYKFASSHAQQAIQGYADLGMLDECEEAIESYFVNSHHDDRERVKKWVEDFRSNPGLTAVNSTLARKKKLTLDDHIAIVHAHTDENLRVQSVKAIAAAADASDDDSDMDKAFNVLVAHARTTDSKPTKSQSEAMRALTQDMEGVVDAQYTGDLEKPQIYRDLVVSELEKTAPHVMHHVFGDKVKTRQFTIRATQLEWNKQDDLREAGFMKNHKRPSVTLSDLLPEDKKGETVAIARNTLAKQQLDAVALHYADTSSNNPFHSSFKDDGDIARQAALLTRHTLLDDTLSADHPQKKQAETILGKLVAVEDRKLATDAKTLEQFLGSQQSWEYKEMAKKHVAQRSTHIGFGRAAVETLAQIVATPQSKAAAARIDAAAGQKKDYKIQ